MAHAAPDDTLPCHFSAAQFGELGVLNVVALIFRTSISLYLTIKYVCLQRLLMPAVQAKEGTPSYDRYTYLLHVLRRYPFWAKGHAALVPISLERKEIALAYGAARAFQILSGESQQTQQLLAQCYLASGQAHHARQVLDPYMQSGAAKNAVKEDYAAALMALGEHAAALHVFESIPPSERSRDSALAIEGCKRQAFDSAES